MSLLPFTVSDLQGIPKSLLHSGMNMHPGNWMHSISNLRPWANAGDHIPNKTHIGSDGFQVSLDVQHFAPSEVTVKTVDDFIEVEAKHDERQDEHSFVSRHFRRRYRLPEGFNIEDVVSSISSDGILTVKVPAETPSLKGAKVRHIQIQQTGPARLNVGDKKEESERKHSIIIAK